MFNQSHVRKSQYSMYRPSLIRYQHLFRLMHIKIYNCENGNILGFGLVRVHCYSVLWCNHSWTYNEETQGIAIVDLRGWGQIGLQWDLSIAATIWIAKFCHLQSGGIVSGVKSAFGTQRSGHYYRGVRVLATMGGGGGSTVTLFPPSSNMWETEKKEATFIIEECNSKGEEGLGTRLYSSTVYAC